MRRRRLPSRHAGTSLIVRESSTDFRYLEQVVSIRFPVQEARLFLQRTMGNSIGFRLVEAVRGEPIGRVRAVEIKHENSGERTWITGMRQLANGEAASFYVPDHLVRIVAKVEGAAAQSRSIGLKDEVILHVPVRGYLRYIPAIYQGEGPVETREVIRARDTALQRWGGALPDEAHKVIDVDEDPIRRFLFLFQHMMTTVTDKIDHIIDLTNPLACDAKFLPWLASWVGFELDLALPVHQQRELVRRAIRLYRTRGTRAGIEEMVRVLTSAPVRIRERQKPAPAALGKATVIGGRDVVERYEKNEPPGSYFFEPKERKATSYFTLVLEPRERFQTRFGERASSVLRRIVQVVSQERPTHVSFTIQFDARR